MSKTFVAHPKKQQTRVKIYFKTCGNNFNNKQAYTN
jgi:hypothetical protein